MSSTTASTENTAPISRESMIKAIQEINLLSKSGQWILIDPTGLVYIGKVEDMTRVLLKEHPLLNFLNKPPSFV